MITYFIKETTLAALALITDPFLSRGAHRASKGGEPWTQYSVGI